MHCWLRYCFVQINASRFVFTAIISRKFVFLSSNQTKLFFFSSSNRPPRRAFHYFFSLSLCFCVCWFRINFSVFGAVKICVNVKINVVNNNINVGDFFSSLLGLQQLFRCLWPLSESDRRRWQIMPFYKLVLSQTWHRIDITPKKKRKYNFHSC